MAVIVTEATLELRLFTDWTFTEAFFQQGRVAFTIEGQSYPRLPEAAIIWGGSGSYIWGVDGDTAFRVPVDIVARNEGHVLVRGDLHAGARIITEGVQKVREGSRIVDVGERETGLAVGGSPIVSDETR